MVLAPGKYWIQRANAGYPKPLIGVEYGPSPVKPILTEADDNVWTLTDNLWEGKYTLALGTTDYHRPIKVFDGKLLGIEDKPASALSIIPSGVKDGDDHELYTIGEVDLGGNLTGKVWTVNNPKPNFPVTLETKNVNVSPSWTQLWKFTPLPARSPGAPGV